MQLEPLVALLTEAHQLCGHRDYVVIGSLAALGMASVMAIPADMTQSIDVDCYTRADPARILDLHTALGEGSAYHLAHGIYLDGVSPDLATLPDGWEQRLIAHVTDAITAFFLEPNDAAISKLARSAPNDLRWVKAGIAAGMVSVPLVRLRMRETLFLDADEEQRAKSALALCVQP